MQKFTNAVGSNLLCSIKSEYDRLAINGITRSEGAHRFDSRERQRLDALRHIVDGFGDWSLSNKQRRLGEENDYIKRPPLRSDDLSNVPVIDALKKIKKSLSLVYIPMIRYVKPVQEVAQLVFKLHMAYLLPATLVVCMQDLATMSSTLHLIARDLLLSDDPNENVKDDIFRKEKPTIQLTYSPKKNVISVVDIDDFWKSLCVGETYHLNTLVIIVNAELNENYDYIVDGAKYISNHVVFIDGVSSSKGKGRCYDL